jgi:hypothetical protein
MRANSSASACGPARLACSVARRNAIRRSSISWARAGSRAISARRLASVLNSMCGSSCDCSSARCASVASWRAAASRAACARERARAKNQPITMALKTAVNAMSPSSSRGEASREGQLEYPNTASARLRPAAYPVAHEMTSSAGVRQPRGHAPSSSNGSARRPSSISTQQLRPMDCA